MAAIINEETHRIEGTRTTVYHVMDYYVENHPAVKIADALRLSSEQVVAAIAFIESHKDEVKTKYQKMLERDEKGNSPEIEARVAQSHKKLLRMKEEFESRAHTCRGR